MNTSEMLNLAEKLIKFVSVPGEEFEVMSFIAQYLSDLGFDVQRHAVSPERFNVFARRGNPKIIFTTHLDVVPAPEHLFIPTLKGDRLFGRGACDAKGIAAAMVAACEGLRQTGETDLGVLLVVGEELDGIGARVAAKELKGHGIQYLINGEPTQNKQVASHKGSLGIRVLCEGKSCHSGYPELGIDANERLLQALNNLKGVPKGFDPLLGKGTLTITMLQGGTAPNVVADKASAVVTVRTVEENGKVLDRIKAALGECRTEILRGASVAHMKTVPDIPVENSVSYSTDIPNFVEMQAEALLYGPGSIHRAHTDEEYITIPEMEQAVFDYITIFKHLKGVMIA